MTSIAIDVRTAAHRPAQPQIRVVRGGMNGLSKAKHTANLVVRVLGVALLLGLIVSVVYSQAKITELNTTINNTRAELTAAQSENDYLNGAISDITNRASLQQAAEERLGLVKADASQVTYLHLEDESIIETSGGTGKMLQDIHTAALDLLGTAQP